MDGIEIADEMIRAASYELAGFDPGYDYSRECVERVIRAAFAVRTSVEITEGMVNAGYDVLRG